MYQHPIHQRRPRRLGSYFLPFLSLIILGLIVVLVFQIVDYFQDRRNKALENKAAVKIVAGRAEMKIWGVSEWTSAIDGSILNEGDIIRTAPGSRVVLSFLNGGAARLGSETELEFVGLKSRDGEDDAAFMLKTGELWLKRSTKETVRTTFQVLTPHFDVHSIGTVFDVAYSTGKESVRVLEGRVKVAVKVEDPGNNSMRVAENLEVALGQEVTLTSSDILALQNRKPLDLLALLSDDFRQSEWYTWNRSEDIKGTTGVTVADAVSKQGSNVIPGLSSADETEQPPMQVVDESSTLSLPGTGLTPGAPEIIAPKPSERQTRSGSVIISGTGGRATEKIEITTYIGGKVEPYVLQKYKPGSENWSYVASRDYGNLVPGENRFRVVAIGKDGKRSEPTELTIIYDRPKEPSDLSAPQVVSFNGYPSSETIEDVVAVEGKIGKGIEKIFVNDFMLTRYIPDKESWTYYAKTSYGNLKEGENSYEVYGVDFDGKKTAVTKFTIIKKPKEPAAGEVGTSSETLPKPPL